MKPHSELTTISNISASGSHSGSNIRNSKNNISNSNNNDYLSREQKEYNPLLTRTTPKEKKTVENRLGNNSPDAFSDINQHFINNPTLENELDNIDSSASQREKKSNNLNDMKYNGPKKDNFTIRISKNTHNYESSTPHKLSQKNDIKDQIGKYYSKIINTPISNTNVYNNGNHSPKSNTNSSISEKGNQSQTSSLLPQRSINSAGNKLYLQGKNTLNSLNGNDFFQGQSNHMRNVSKTSNSYSQNFQQKFMNKK
jgi:hypothetical protein